MQPKKKLILGYANLANSITLFGLILSLSSCFLVLNGNLTISIILLISSGICDLFDGVVARKTVRTDLEKEFGIQLDTVADVVSFAITPVIIVYTIVGVAWYALVIYMFYVICAVLRLAYFNTTAVSGLRTTHYQGLPVTYIAVILPSVLLLQSTTISIIMLAFVGTLFVVNIKIPKPRGIWYVLFPIIAVVVSVLWWVL